MELSSLIGFPKDEVIEIVKKQNLKFKVIDLDDNKNFDTELFVKFEYINNILTLYFDKFKLHI